MKVNTFKYFVISIFGSIVAVACISNSTSATSTSTTASVNVAEACTMYADITTPHTAIVSPNTYQADIGITTINVTCNDPSGYAIYAVGYTGNTIGDTNSTKLVSTDGNNTINTGTATSGSASNWAMKLATSGSSYVATLDNSFGSYHAVPTDYTKVAHYNSATDIGNNATGSTLTTTYAAFVTGNQSAGTYLGKVKYTMVHPASEIVPHEIACDPGKICYNANTAIIEGQMGKQTPSSSELTNGITLWASNFKRDGYGFAGWSDKYDYETNEDAHFYGPNETITTPSDLSTNGLSLYAVWIKSEGSIQSDASSICNNLTQSGPNVTKTLYSVSALTDERDNNTYAIAKLADSNCWMIENLRLADKDSNNNSINLSSSNTHNPSLPLTNVYDSSTTSNHLSANTDPATTAWCQTNSSACDDQSMLATNNTTLFTSNTASGYSASSNVYSYGNYYNWYSATAGHGTYSKSSGNTSGDICPAGWHLPKGGNKSQESTNEFWQLITTGLNNGINPANYDSSTQPYYTGTEAIPVSNALRSYPNNFVYSGVVNGSSVNGRSSDGGYWSSSATNNRAYYLSFYSSVFPGTASIYKYSGRVARCVAGV